MTTYKLEKELPSEAEEIPGIPDVLKQHLIRKLRGPAVRVKVEARVSAVSHDPINAIRLADRGAANTSVDIDAVAELVTRIVHHYHVEHETTEGYQSLYRITCELRSTENRKPMTERTFVLRYLPGQESEETDLMRENDVLHAALESLRESRDGLAVQNADLHEVVLRFAGMMVEPIRASSELSHNATAQWINGANMLVQGYQNLFNIDAVRTQEAAKTERINAVLAQFGGTIGNLTAGLVDFAFKKLNLGGGSAPAASASPAAAPVAASTEVDGEAQGEEQIDPHRALAALVEAFSHGITPQQRKALNNGLNKKQITALDDLFCAQTNDEVADAWKAASATLGLEKLLWLRSQLSADQQGDFASIAAFIGKYDEKRKADAKKK